jgi:hypothetical protein
LIKDESIYQVTLQHFQDTVAMPHFAAAFVFSLSFFMVMIYGLRDKNSRNAHAVVPDQLLLYRGCLKLPE